METPLPDDLVVELPTGWEFVDGGPGVDVMALGPGHELALRPTLVIVGQRVDPRLELDDWFQSGLEELSQLLIRPQAIDKERLELAGLSSRRLLGHHAVEGVGGVTLECWWVLGKGQGWVVSISTPSLDYAATSDAISALGRGLHLRGRAG